MKRLGGKGSYEKNRRQGGHEKSAPGTTKAKQPEGLRKSENQSDAIKVGAALTGLWQSLCTYKNMNEIHKITQQSLHDGNLDQQVLKTMGIPTELTVSGSELKKIISFFSF